MKEKGKMITFRVEEPMHKFLKKFSMEQGMTVSQLVRNILSYFWVSYFMGKAIPRNVEIKDFFDVYLPELEKEFVMKYGSEKQKKRYLRKIKKRI